MARLFLRSGLAENSVNRGGFGLYRAGVLVYLQPLNSSWTGSRMAQNSGLMQGKRGVILGVANSALYLLSHLSRGVTGEVHHVDSGYHVFGLKRPEAPDISLSLGKE
jgi:hypothetical protein